MESEKYPNSFVAAANLHSNRLALASQIGRYPDYTPAAPGHYWGLHYWDQVFHSIIDARNSSQIRHIDKQHLNQTSLDAATTGLRTLLRGQKENGFITSFQDLGPSRRIEPERWFGYETEEQCNYTHPPLLALGIAEVYQSLSNQVNKDTDQSKIEAKAFLEEMYGPAKLAYEYLDKYRRVSHNDRRMFILHPHETGRDSDPTYNYLKCRIPRRGIQTPQIIDKANSVLDYFQIIRFGNRLRNANGDIQKARELFGAVDLMMNSMLVDNLEIMANLAQELGKDEDVDYFRQYANDVENKIFEKMWFPQARGGEGAFYSTDKNGQQLTETSINNLFALALPNLSEDQFESLLNLLDRSFDVPYPLPSVGTNSLNFDPYNREFERLWRGGTWINANWYLVERGLKKQISRKELAHRPDLIRRSQQWTNRIVVSSKLLVAKSGLREFYNPLISQGQRRRVRMMGWSNLAHVINPAYVNLDYQLAEAA